MVHCLLFGYNMFFGGVVSFCFEHCFSFTILCLFDDVVEIVDVSEELSSSSFICL